MLTDGNKVISKGFEDVFVLRSIKVIWAENVELGKFIVCIYSQKGKYLLHWTGFDSCCLI